MSVITSLSNDIIKGKRITLEKLQFSEDLEWVIIELNGQKLLKYSNLSAGSIPIEKNLGINWSLRVNYKFKGSDFQPKVLFVFLARKRSLWKRIKTFFS